MSDGQAAERGPLFDIRVLDLTNYQAGALAGQMLADMGADVIKVEPPGRGDPSRTAFEPMQGEDSAYFLSLNRNKRSLAANLKDERGRELVQRMLPHVDVLIENQRPGGMERFGLGYDDVRAVNPRIIYASVTGYGTSGPSADESALDPAIQAYSGIMSITGRPDTEPLVVGSNISGTAASSFCYGAIASALYARERTGEGQRVSVSMLDATLVFLRSRESHYFATGEVPGRVGNVNRYFAPMEVFETADGHLQLSVQHDHQWETLCELLGADMLAADERYATNADRVRNRDPLAAQLAPYIRERTTQEWRTTLRDKGIMCMPIHDIADVFADPQVAHNDMLVEIEHPKAGTLQMLGIPQKLSATPGRVRTPPPGRGAHTADVLRELLAMSDDELDELAAAGVIEVAPQP